MMQDQLQRLHPSSEIYKGDHEQQVGRDVERKICSESDGTMLAFVRKD
jgi:hypothetical protein